jgi:2-polyprenyl-3-methyl-5-hydroxy-6-metoxy-1,4-benzoquinol methylase
MSTPVREAEIRPDFLKPGQAERYASDIRRLLACRSEFVRVPCPACGSWESQEAFQKYEFTYQLCRGCETIYTSPRPPPAVLEMYYATSENYAYWNQHIFPASEAARREKIFRPRAERVVDICRLHGVATESLLEVGAGFGTFCEEARRLGLFRRIVAVEPTPDLARTCRERGLEVIERPVEQVELEGDGFDVIAGFELIEHLFSPGDFIRQCARLLRPGGLLILTCPNVKGFDVATLQAVSDTVDTEHLNYFHPASLSRLVAANGFDVLEVQTPGRLDAELVRKKAIEGVYDLSGQPFLRQVLLEEWERLGDAFQQFLASNGLSSHMWLVARRQEVHPGTQR